MAGLTGDRVRDSVEIFVKVLKGVDRLVQRRVLGDVCVVQADQHWRIILLQIRHVEA